MLLHKKWQIYYIKIIFSHSFLSPLPFLSPETLPLSRFFLFFTRSPPSGDGTDRRSLLRVAPTLAYSPMAWNDVEQGWKRSNQLLNRTPLLRFRRRFGHGTVATTFHQLGLARKLPLLARSRLNSAGVELLQLVRFELETSPIAVVTPCQTSDHSSCHKWAPQKLNLA